MCICEQSSADEGELLCGLVSAVASRTWRGREPEVPSESPRLLVIIVLRLLGDFCQSQVFVHLRREHDGVLVERPVTIKNAFPADSEPAAMRQGQRC